MTVTVVSPTPHGTIATVIDTLIYTPASGFAGVDTIVYTVSNGQYSSTAMIVISVLISSGLNESDAEGKISLYPNPTHDRATILFTGGVGAISLNVTVALGRDIRQSIITGTSYKLDAEAPASGVYLCTADDARGHRAAGKISVVH